MTPDAVIGTKLIHLQGRCAFLRRYQGKRRGARRLLGGRGAPKLAVERAFQEAIEACLDLGRRVLIAVGVPLPDTNREVFLLLARQGLVPEDRVERWADMAGFCNVLVHACQLPPAQAGGLSSRIAGR